MDILMLVVVGVVLLSIAVVFGAVVKWALTTLFRR